MKINDQLPVPTGKIQIIIRDAKTGKIKSEDYINNMFVTAGKNSLASGMIGTTTNNKGIITYCAMGTGSTAPALTDTALETELGRKQVSVRSVADNIATYQIFFTTSEVNGTLLEAGLFGDDASATANSGTLFARAAINRTKSSADTMTVSWSITIG